MKVLQIITSLETGGAEKLILESVPLYQKKGLEMDVLLLSDRPSAFREDLESLSQGRIFGLTKKSIYNPFLIFKIIPYLRKYDLIHAHLFPVVYWVVFAKLISFNKTPIVYTEHSTSNGRRKYPLFKILDRFVYGFFSKIACISEGVCNELKAHLGSSKKTCVINNGLSLNKFKVSSGEKKDKFSFFSPDDKVLIQVSSFRQQKDQETLISAIQYLPENIKLLLVGDGDLRNEREKQVTLLQLENRVLFLGKRYDIPSLLRYSDIVIQSSKIEGFGLAIVEGMATGRPVIASDIEGLREIVGGYGLLFKQGDAKGLAEQILVLINDQGRYDEVSARCLYRSNDFSIDRMVDEYIKVYYENVK